MSLLCCIRAFGGATINTSSATIYDTTLFNEAEFLVELATSDFSAMALAWQEDILCVSDLMLTMAFRHYSYKVCSMCLMAIVTAQILSYQVASLYCLGYIEEAVQLGFRVYEMRKALPK